MIEFLLEIAGVCLKLLRSEVPDCVAVLKEIASGKRSISSGGRPYVWLCRLTGVARLLRGTAVVWLGCLVVTLASHPHLGWPPFNFNDGHKFLIGASVTSSSLTPITIQYCEWIAIFSVTLVIATLVFFDSLARLSRMLVQEFCPVSNSPERPVMTAGA
jgi:hypothetical protein